MSTPIQPALELSDITRRFADGDVERAVLDRVSLTLQPGEMIAIMGPSGSGKSTLLNVAGTLIPPTAGRVLINGHDVAGLPAARLAELKRREIGVVFQDHNLISTLTAAENIALPLELDGIGSRDADQRAREALEDLGLIDLADRFPSEISGGQAQRIAIARGLIGNRRLLLADEPTGALDTATGEAVMKLLRARVDAGAACLLVTHEPRFAAWAERTVTLRDGRIIDRPGDAS